VRRRLRGVIAAGATVLFVAAVVGASASVVDAAAPPARDASNATPGNYGWFEQGTPWTGQFADPTVVRVGSTYYAYASGAGGRYLGVMISHDGVHWLPHDRWSHAAAPWAGGPNPLTDPNIPTEIRHGGLSAGDTYNLNDALVRPAAWGVNVTYNSWMHRSYWAVGVTRIGTTWYAYAPVRYSRLMGDGTADAEGFGRYCLTVATASSPLGPFRDRSGSRPWYCDPDPGGSIDPAPFTDAHGNRWLTWKANGRRPRPGVSGYPSSLKSVRLDAHGNMTGPISTLLTTAQGTWEGETIENPSIIGWHSHYYLFYSANWFGADAHGNSPYATGYAICSTPAGPCHRPSRAPLMASNAREQGPGGASAFTDTHGQLRLVYASYWPGENRAHTNIPHPRRMHIVTVTYHSNGTLTVVH
jgi:beta-xylosidase